MALNGQLPENLCKVMAGERDSNPVDAPVKSVSCCQDYRSSPLAPPPDPTFATKFATKIMTSLDADQQFSRRSGSPQHSTSMLGTPRGRLYPDYALRQRS
jgi:hypothetical protein